MDSDLYLDTDCLLKNLKNGMELVVSTEDKGIGLYCLLVRSISEILKHGLRDPKQSFWHIVRDLTHPSTRQSLARSLRHVSHNPQRGLFWIYYTLVEGSLDSYMQCLITDRQTVWNNYLNYAFLRDNFCVTKFILLLTSFSQVRLTPLDSTTCPGLQLQIKREVILPSDTNIVSSPCSVISSPGDSGLHESMEEEVSSSDCTFTPIEEAFSDCSLSTATEPVNKASVEFRQRKRVSFHETVIGDEPKGTIWERRSCDVETMAWWKAGCLLQKSEREKSEKGLDALSMERGAPEGSEDPQIDFVEPIHSLLEQAESSKKTNLIGWKRHVGKRRPKAVSKGKSLHLMNIYPGPWKSEKVDSDETELIIVSHKIEDPPQIIQVMERILNTNIFKMYNMFDSDGFSYVCLLAKQELCLLNLTKTHSLNMQRIQYKDMRHIIVGPSSEHLTLQDGRKFILTTRGEDFCSWLHYAVYKETHENLDFIRVDARDTLSKAFAKQNLLKVDDVIFNSWAVMCDSLTVNDFTYKDYLMVSVGTSKFWEPSFVEISPAGFLEIRPCSNGCKNLRFPLNECSYCDRCNTSGRPYTFKLQFEKKSPKDKIVLNFAAPDDNSVACWMQAILIAVGLWKENKICTKWKNEHTNDGGHHLLATYHTLFLINSRRASITRKTPLSEIASLIIGPAYLIIELDCHEVEDKANDWVLYFLSEEIKMGFLEFIRQLKPELNEKIFQHIELSCNWEKCVEERNHLDRGFQQITSYLLSNN